MNTDAIDAADMLATALREEVAQLSERGADALFSGRLGETKLIINRIEQCEAFCDAVDQLNDDLRSFYSGFTEDEDSGSTNPDDANTSARKQERTDPALMNAKRKNILHRLEKKYGVRLNRRSTAIYRSDGNQVGIVCTMSKWHSKNENYWYAYHPHQDKFLAMTKQGYFVLGMMDANVALALPVEVVRQNLTKLNTTTTPAGRSYWHIHVSRSGNGSLSLQRARGEPPLALDRYTVSIEE